MTRMLRVARFEYVRHVLHRRFLTATLGMPLLIALSMALAYGAARVADGGRAKPWGIVGASPLPGAPQVFDDRTAAAEALAAREIGGYVVVAPDGRAQVRSSVPMPDALEDALRMRVLDAVLADVAADAADVLRVPARLRYTSLESGTQPLTGWEVRLRLAVAVGVPLVFAIAVVLATSFLVLAVAEEKENRLMEVLVTSVAPETLMGGKVIGLGLLSLTQTLFWLASLFAALLFARRVIGIGIATDVPWGTLLVSAPFFLLGYLLYAAIMTGIGVVVGQAREAQQVAGFISVLLLAPFIIMGLIILRPRSPAAVALSLLPPTAPVAMPMRLAIGVAAPWEILLSLLLLGLSIKVGFDLLGRVFRATMLLYGQRPTPRVLLAALRG